MKSLKDILTSASFMREVSLLLFAFAAFNFLISALLIVFAGSNSNAIASGVAAMITAIINFVLAVLIRRGSLKALWCAGILFLLDTLLVFLAPPSQAVGGMVVSRLLLIIALVRYIRRQRAMTS